MAEANSGWMHPGAGTPIGSSKGTVDTEEQVEGLSGAEGEGLGSMQRRVQLDRESFGMQTETLQGQEHFYRDRLIKY